MSAIPAPSVEVLELGPLSLHLYALCIMAGIVVATLITARRWVGVGGQRELALEVAVVGTLGGLVGARLYHLATSWDQVSEEWWGPLAVWEGGLGIWGGILGGALAGAWVVRRRGASVRLFMDAAAPAILIAQGIGRIGNYVNQELFGGPTDLPWALEVDPGSRPSEYAAEQTFHPTFLYELLWNVGFALFLIWLGRRFRIRPPGLFCLYVAGYSFGRIFLELLRVDPSRHVLGLRLNFYVAGGLFLAGLIAFVLTQRRPARPAEGTSHPDPTSEPADTRARR